MLEQPSVLPEGSLCDEQPELLDGGQGPTGVHPQSKPRKSKADTHGPMDQFRDRYQVVVEEGGALGDPWMEIIPGSRGHIYVHSLTPPKLGVSLDRKMGASRTQLAQLAAAGVVEITQDGDDGANAIFSIEHSELIFGLVGARKRRRNKSSPHQLQKLAEAGRQHRFRSKPR